MEDIQCWTSQEGESDVFDDEQVQKYLTRQYEAYRERQKEKAILAWVFVTQKKFTLLSYERQLQLHPNYFRVYNHRYDTISAIVARQIFRVLERYIEIECDAPVKTLTNLALRPMLKYVTGCHNKMSDKDRNTLVNLAIFTYNFKDIELNKEHCFELYEHLIEHAPISENKKRQMQSVVKTKTIKFEKMKRTTFERERPQADKNNPTYFLNMMWTPEYQAQLVTAFREKQDFIYVRDYFHQRYPELSRFFAPISLKNRLRRILRKCLLDLTHKYVPMYAEGIPKLIPFSDTIRKCFYRSPGCSNLQVILLKMWDNTFTLMDCMELVTKMNSLTVRWNKQKEAGIIVRGKVKR